MTALPAFMYRDPLDVLIGQEARSCRGCVHRDVIFGKEVCTKGRRARRCKHYNDTKEKTACNSEASTKP